jgi:hypothetical protein
VLYASVVLTAGPGRVWESLVRYPIEDFGAYQSLPLPLVYDGPTEVVSLGAGGETLAAILVFYVPLVLERRSPSSPSWATA